MLTPIELLPKTIAPAVLIYLLLCYGLGDVFAGRLAERIHIPACVEGQVAAASKSNYGRNLKQQIARDLLGALLQNAPAMRDIPGMRVIEGASKNRPEPDHTRSTLARCRCLSGAALSETKFDHMLWVASLRVHKPSGVAQFAGVMTRLDQANTCGNGSTS